MIHAVTVRALRPVWLTSVLLIALNALAFAQEVPDGTDANKNEFREQTIYVPYDRLDQVFEKKGRGVFIPYEKFQELWEAARSKKRQTPDKAPPLPAIITEIDSVAVAGKDVMEVTAKLQIELLTDGWQRVPLRLKDAAVRSALIGGEPARIVVGKNGYDLLIRRDPPTPTDAAADEDGDPSPEESSVIELTLVYAKAIQKTPGHNSVSMQAPQAPVNRWSIRIPEDGVKIDVQPLIAATESPAVGDPAAEPPQETVLLAFVGSADHVRIDWNPRAEGASGLAALLAVDANQQVYIEEGVIRTHCVLNYRIRRAELSDLEIEVPADHKVAGVFDQNIRQWEVKDDGEIQRIIIQLFEPAREQQQVAIDLEKFASDDLSDVVVPRIAASNVGRQQGTVLVSLTPALRSKANTTDGLVQLDANEIPAAQRNRSWAYSYRYSALPFTLSFSLDKIEPRITVDELTEVYLESNRMLVDWTLLMHIEKAGVFQVRVNLPTGYQLRRVEGRECGGAQKLAIDSSRVDGPETDSPTLEINLTQKAIGDVALVVALEKTLDHTELQEPTGESASIPIDFPSVAMDVERVSGRLVVRSPESLRVNPDETTGLKSDSLNEVFQTIATAENGRFPESRPVLAFSYGDEAKRLSLNGQRRRPQVNARQLLKVEVESGVATFTSTFTFDIRYSPVESLRIDLPVEVASTARNETKQIRDEVIDPAPDDVPEGYVAWMFSGESELIGQQQIVLTWQQTKGELAVGEPFTIPVPRLLPVEVDRSWGQIVATRDDTIDVRPLPDLKGLRLIDPQLDLMDGIQIEDASRAFEFQQEQWTLTLQATRYDLVEVKRTSIDRGWLRMVVTRSDQIDVQALYRMRSAQQRVPIRFPKNVIPDQSFDSQPLRINGQPTNLERGEDDLFYIPIPLRTGDANAPFVVELRYTTTTFDGLLELPEFPSDPAVGKVTLTAHIPEELAVIMQHGDWSDDNPNPWLQTMSEYALTNQYGGASAGDIWDDISKGVSVVNSPVESFDVQGTAYYYSVHRPAAGAGLSLRVMSLRNLNLCLFAVVALLSLLAFRSSLSKAVTLVGGMIIAVIVVGVFWPSLGVHLIDGKLALGLLVVGIAWTMGSARRIRWRLPTRTNTETSDESDESAETNEEASSEDGTADATTGEESEFFIGDEDVQREGESDE
jgi:hypothetical protein